ncbi:MAG: diguanylate cyclase [Holophagales bacterium]|nr:diguanylate cyclase [Holophagales bacterium]
MKSNRPRALHLATTGILILLVVALWLVRVDNAQRAAGRTIGVFFEPAPTGLEISDVVPGGAADRAGLEDGDIISGVGGIEVAEVSDYDRAAAHFARGREVSFEILRQGRPLTLPLVPGRDVSWLQHGIAGFVTLCCLALGLLALFQRSHDLRARLITAFSFLLAVELAMPPVVIGEPRLTLLVSSLFYLVTGAQLALELHLASLIPERQPWLKRRPWAVVSMYIFGLGFGVLTWGATVAEALLPDTIPVLWSEATRLFLLNQIVLPIWALGVTVLLAVPTFSHPDRRGRHQAGLVLGGVAPWVAYVVAMTAYGWAGANAPLWIDDLFPLVVLAFPVGVFLSIFRFHLFDIDLVVRRGFLYTALTSALVLLFYLAVGSLGMLFSKVVDEAQYSLWATAGAMFVVGLLFGTVRSFLKHTIDRFLFPEGQALRRSLVALASELPAQGTVSAMGRHLVERLGEILAVRSATLLLADPKSGLFFSVASDQPQEDSFSPSFLLAPEDPALDRLRREARPIPAEQVAESSPALGQRLRALGAHLVAPLLVDDRLVGVLVLGSPHRQRRFSREEVELLDLVCRHVAIAFENVRLFESATYESLTGLLRREAVLEVLDKEIERARRYGRPLVVGMADLDFFKDVNDRYGHIAGDAVLKRVAEELSGGLRSTDSVGRYGGEEFLLVFPETRLEGGSIVAEKLRERIEKLSLPIQDGQPVDPRISIGLAELGAEDGGRSYRAIRSQELVEAADKALYQAKANGRNRVELAEPIVAAGGD